MTVIVFQIIAIVGLILCLNYPFVWYKTEEKAFSKFVELYGNCIEKQTTETNGVIETRCVFKKDDTKYVVSVKNICLGIK